MKYSQVVIKIVKLSTRIRFSFFFIKGLLVSSFNLILSVLDLMETAHKKYVLRVFMYIYTKVPNRFTKRTS